MHSLRRAFLVVAASLLVVAGPLGSAAGAAKDKGSPKPVGTDVYVAPAGTPKALLHVFLHGSELPPADQTVFLEASASFGFRTLAPATNNFPSVTKLCKKAPSDCWAKVRNDIAFGGKSSGKISVNYADSIEGQLVTSLNGHGLSSFVVNGKPDYPKIALTGHSRGSQFAAYMATKVTVARVGLIGGLNDLMRKPKDVPPWLTSSGGTSRDRWFTLGHIRDLNIDTQCKSWDKLGIPVSGSCSAAGATPTGGQRLVTDAGGNLDEIAAHLSLVVDDELIRANGNGQPVLTNSWKALLGA